jgi:hypothetical protein
MKLLSFFFKLIQKGFDLLFLILKLHILLYRRIWPVRLYSIAGGGGKEEANEMRFTHFHHHPAA